jgi:hypothetical protein
VSEIFDAAQAVRDALTSQVGAATTSEVIAAVEEVIDDAVDVALAASDMDTSLFVPIGVEEIREGTIRTEIIEDRDTLLTNIAAAGQTAYDDAIAIDAGDTVAAEAAREAAISEQREDLLTVTTIVQREAEPDPAPVVNTGNPPPVEPSPEPEAIVVMSNADDKVISTSGADDRFEVVPQVFMSDMDQKLDNQEFGRDVIVDLDDRASVSLGGGSAEETAGFGAGSSAEETAHLNQHSPAQSPQQKTLPQNQQSPQQNHLPKKH